MMAETLKLVSGGDDIKIWEPPNLRLVQTFKPHSKGVSSLAWSPNNNFLASTAPGEPIVVTSFKGSTPNSVELLGCEDETCVTFNTTSRHLLTGGKSKVLNLWDLKTRTIKKKIKIPRDAVNCVTFNWNDTNIASGTTEGDIYIHSVSTTQTSAPLRLPKTQAIHSMQYSKFKKSMLGSVSDDGSMNIWDTNAKKISASFPDQHTAPAMDLGFSPMNDMLLATAGLDKKIVFYDVLGKKVIKEMSAESPLCSISFMQDGAAFAVGSTRGKIYIYDLRSGSTPLQTTLAHKSAIHGLSFQLPPKGSSNSSSSTLAEKFTNRSSSDTTKSTTPSLNDGIPGQEVAPAPPIKRPAPPEPVQNGLKTNEESGIFSPLRDGLVVNSNVVGKELKQSDPPPSARKTENIQVSGIFSPVSTSTSSYQPVTSTIKTDTFITSTTHDQNGYPAAGPKEKPSQLAKQSLTSASSIPSTGSATNDDETGKLTSDKNKLDSHLNRDIQTTLPKSRDKQATPKSASARSSSLMHVEDSRVDRTTEQQTEDVMPHGSAMKSSSSLTGSREVLNSFLQPSQTNNAESPSGFQQFQIQFMKNLIDDSLDEFRINFHRDIVNLQVEMLRQFQIQQNEMKTLLQQYSLNDALVEENEKLREEIKRLKANH